ncbi:MAG: hypothetical protein GF408_04620 [Candidatus Omnitrophica bacterium]|nr:hypothetical protein [Candidatus Omnitrophota bacterium]
MKKIMIMAVLVLFALGSTAFAGGGGPCSSSGDHRPASKSIKKGSFQGASDHINSWGKSRAEARELSLRGDKKALKKRMKKKQW